MRHKGFLILFSFFTSLIISFSQDPSEKPTRSEIFDRMEARAKSLAKRMEEMSGKESQSPLQVSAPSQTQPSSNSKLPLTPSNSAGLPVQENWSSSVPNNLISEDRNPESSSEAFYVVDDSDDYLPIESAQELLGDYYISPAFGFVLSSESIVQIQNKNNNTVETLDLDNEVGFTVGMEAGFRFDDFFAELGLKYSSLEYKTHTSLNNKPILGDGSVSVLNFSARLGYSYSLSDLLSINGSLGLGLSNRKNFLQQNPNIDYELASSETVLSYDLAFSINYFMAESYLISLGYNYMNVGKISQFDALNLHYFELGLGLNF